MVRSAISRNAIDGVLVVVGINGRGRTVCEHARAMCCNEHELKPVGYLVDALKLDILIRLTDASRAAGLLRSRMHCIVNYPLYRTFLFVSGINQSTLRLSRRDWTRLHVRTHSRFVMWVPESHMRMQSVTALSCSVCLNFAALGSRRSVVKVAGAGIVCADDASAPRVQNTIGMSSKRMRKFSGECARNGSPASPRKQATEWGHEYAEQISCCPAGSAHEG